MSTTGQVRRHVGTLRPEAMTVEQRSAELAAALANGYLRLMHSPNPLDSKPAPEAPCAPVASEKESPVCPSQTRSRSFDE